MIELSQATLQVALFSSSVASFFIGLLIVLVTEHVATILLNVFVSHDNLFAGGESNVSSKSTW